MQTITDLTLAQRILKLPGWAQDVIYDLDRELAEARRQIAMRSGGPDGSNVRVNEFGIRPDRMLGKDIPVSFDVPGGTVVIKHDASGGLEVYCTGPGAGHYPQIMPGTANTFRIRLGER